MKTCGIITKIDGKKIEVTVYKESSCASCNKCIESDKNIGTFEVETDEIYSISEEVAVEIDSKFILKNSILLYIFPVVMFFLFYFIGELFFTNKDFPIYFSFLSIIISFFILKILDKKKNKKMDLKIYKL
ncbi:MAG: SoxR reducing system RseC family protein [Fusobacteria bacterium]|nr:SoxR reducing system RseC family protein [Fusobacteriota bacterium]